MSTDPAFASGESCYLRALRREDAQGRWAGWLNDPEVTQWMFRGVFPTTPESTESFYESVANSETDLVLAIVAREGDVHVGNVGLHRIDWVNRSAEFGILIGERDWLGRGVGTEATRLILRHGFDRLNLNRIWLGVFADHEAAVALYRGLGFVEEGRLRQAALRDGAARDQLIMGLLAADFPAS